MREPLPQGLAQHLHHRRVIQIVRLGPPADVSALLHHQRQLREPGPLAGCPYGLYDVPRAEIVHAHHQLLAGLTQKRRQFAPPRIRAHVRHHAHPRRIPAQLGASRRHVADRRRRGRALGQ